MINKEILLPHVMFIPYLPYGESSVSTGNCLMISLCLFFPCAWHDSYLFISAEADYRHFSIINDAHKHYLSCLLQTYRVLVSLEQKHLVEETTFVVVVLWLF